MHAATSGIQVGVSNVDAEDAMVGIMQVRTNSAKQNSQEDHVVFYICKEDARWLITI